MSAPGLFLVGCLVTLIVAGAMALLIYAAILDGHDSDRTRADGSRVPTPSRSIVEIARETGRLSTLAAALDRAGLADTLVLDGPYTVFAPSDAAFAKLPEGVADSLLDSPELLANILTYHVVPGRLTAAEVARRRWATTVQGEELLVSNNGAVSVGGARVVTGDIHATNGLIHVIDRVLIPARI